MHRTHAAEILGMLDAGDEGGGSWHILDVPWDLMVMSTWSGGNQDARAAANVPAPINNSAVDGDSLTSLQDWSSNNVSIDAFIGDLHLNTDPDGVTGNTFDTEATEISYLIGGAGSGDPGTLTIDGVEYTIVFIYKSEGDGGTIYDSKGTGLGPRVTQRGDGRIDFTDGSLSYDYHNTGSHPAGYHVGLHTQSADFARGYWDGAMVFEDLSGGNAPGANMTFRSIFSLDGGSSRLRSDLVAIGFYNGVLLPAVVDQLHQWIADTHGLAVAPNP